jgi:hypothetical protein
MSFSALALAVALAASPKVSVEYRGTLRDALKVIAQKGEINLVVMGELSQPAEVMLKDVSAEDALETVAKAYQLDLKRDDKIWTLRERGAPTSTATKTPGGSLLEQAESLKQQAQALKENEGELKHQAGAAKGAASERAAELAEQAKERAEELKEASQELNAAIKEQAHDLSNDAHAQRAAFGGPVVIKAGDRVESAVAFGGSVTVEEGAVVEDDAVAFGGDVVLEKNSRVEGDAVSWGGQVKRADGAKVEGQIVSMGEGALGNKLAAGAFKMSGPAVASKRDSEPASSFAWFLLQYALTFGMGFVFLMLTPQRIKTMEADITRNPVQVGLVGLLAAVLLVPVTVMLCITVIGIPVALVMWLLMPIALAMGFTALANVVGMHLPFARGRRTQAIVLALGLLAVLVLSHLPVFGVIASLAAGLVSLGTIVRTRLGARGQGQPIQDISFFDQAPTQPVA